MLSDEDLTTRIDDLRERANEMAEYLELALEYALRDPQSALTKCRIVLEKVLTTIYAQEMGLEPSRSMIGPILSDKGFVGRIPRRILARMNFIRELTNLGPHGEQVQSNDVQVVIEILLDVIDWCMAHYGTLGTTALGIFINPKTIEMLPKLRPQYSGYLRPNIRSVKLGQTKDRCFLEITTYNVNLDEETIKRTDLGFIADDKDTDGLFFNPSRSLEENLAKFIIEFDEISIINCTELFSADAATFLSEYWDEHGKTPSGR